MILLWAWVVTSAAAIAGCVYLVVAMIAVGRFARRPSPTLPASPPAVTTLKPLHGVEPDLLENLESFCTQDYPSKVQYVFGVRDANDAAIPTVEELRRANPGMRY